MTTPSPNRSPAAAARSGQLWPWRHLRPAALGAVLAGALGLGLVGTLLPSAGDAQNRPPGVREAQYTQDGTETCMRCHGGERMTSMADTPHGNEDNPHTPWAQHGCESCHGPGSVHSSRAGGGKGFPRLVTFSAEEEIAPQLAACLSCHSKDLGDLPGMAWTGSLHDEAGLGCMDCHQGHAVEDALAQQAAQTDSCAMCHRKQIANHPRFENKGIEFDTLDCYTCHDVHQLMADPHD